jgi:hypothetical protein
MTLFIVRVHNIIKIDEVINFIGVACDLRLNF